MLKEIIREIEHCLFIVLIILAFCGYISAEYPWMPEELPALCENFPCQFQGPVYQLEIKSMKYLTIKRKGG